jgi:peptidoglycan hydrolase-like protein with peptidoglycan-binding domain
MGMRISAAIFSVLLGTSLALAENDPKAPYGPQAATVAGKPKPPQQAQARAAPRQAAKPKAKAKPKPKVTRAAQPAAKPEAKPAEPANPKRQAAKPKPQAVKPKPEAAKPKEAAKPREAAKPKPEIAKPAPRATEKPSPKAANAEPPSKPSPKEANAKPEPAAAPSATGATAPAAAAKIDQGLRDSYAAIPLAERIALQSDLIWTGDYNGLINGEFSERLVQAVKSYQQRQKSKTTGVLNPQERAALRAAARPRQNEVGWRLTEDPATGARIGLPLKLATKREPAGTGTRWSSQQGQLQIETFRIDTGATLEGVFEQQKKDPPQRRVTYNVLRDGFFVVSGTQGLKKFYVRGHAQNGEVRGITILYDQAEAHMDSMMVAMSNAFAPFATYAVAGAPDTPGRKRVDYATGLVVSPSGHIVTARQVVEGCQVIVVPGLGHAEHVAEQADVELALIRVYGARKLSPIGLAVAASPQGAATLVGIADPQAQGGGAAITTVATKVAVGAPLLSLESPPAPGFSGAATLDGKGELLGVVVLKPAVVAGAPTAPRAGVVPVAAIRNFLEANHVAPSSSHPGVEHAKSAVVRVICVRK